jgi:methyl-accepting chemotaxis protein
MPNRAPVAAAGHLRRRVLTRLAALLAVGILFALVMAPQWRATGQQLSLVDAERHGVAYLQPLGQLIAELTEAQSSAVRGGQPVVSRLDAAVNAVSMADDAHGDPLATHGRWSDLRSRAGALVRQRIDGDQAYTAYSEVLALAVDLARRVGDTSQLTVDPALDSHYLTDAVLRRVPDALVGTGRAADLAALADKAPSDVAQVRVSVARYQVAAASDGLSTSLRRAMGVTRSATLTPNLVGHLDAFRSTVDTFVPPAMLLQTLGRSDAAALAAGADRVRQQARALADAVLGELDALLRDRRDRLAGERGWEVAGIVVGTILGIALLGLVLPAAATGRAGSPEPEPGPAPADGGPGDDGGDTTFVDPRDLAAVEELLHVGRAVRTARRERAGDAG